MAGESFLLSGDQIATYTGSNVTHPGGQSEIELTGLSTLGDGDSRFFLVRTQGEGDMVVNGDFYAVYPAVDEGSGNLVPGPTPVIEPNFATPDAYDNTGAGDDYAVFGLFGGTRFAIDLDGFNGASSTTYRQADEPSGDDGELSLAEIEAANPDGVACFARGTRIDTAQGPVPVETLAPGDRLRCVDGRLQPVLWVGSVRVRLGGANRRFAPIRFQPGALGPGLPARPLDLSPSHCVAIRDYRAELLLGVETALVPARLLVNGTSIAPVRGLRAVEYWHVLCPEHALLRAEGVAAESFLPGDCADRAFPRDARAELRLLQRGAQPPLPQMAVAPVLRAHEARALLG